MRLYTLFAAAAVAASLALTGCNHSAEKAEVKKATPVADASKSLQIFESHDEGRINMFYDRKTFDSYKAVGETAYRLTRIGAGPNGETIVYGLPKADKKKGAKTPAAMFMDGKLEVTSFYGEMYKEGRIYVFDGAKEMAHVRHLGHPSYMYTQIGAGPKGETVVYVLNKSNKKKKPVDLIAKFEGMHK